MPQDQANFNEEEIDLRDYIKVIIKRRKIILTIFLVSVMTTATISFFMPKVYQATVSIMVLSSQISNALSPERVSLTGKPSVSLLTHKELLKSDIVMARVIDSLHLADKSGKALVPEDLKTNLNINNTKKSDETNILELIVKSDGPKKAQKIANAWANEYIKYNQELISGEVKGTGDFVVSQFEIVQQNLFQVEEQIKNFKDKNRIELKQAELKIKNGKLDEYKKELIDLELSYKSKVDNLEQLKNEIEKQEKFIVVSKAITDDALWQRSTKEKDSSSLDRKKLRSEVINPIYQDLSIRIVNTQIDLNTIKPRIDYLKKAIILTEEEVGKLEKDIRQKEFELIQLTRRAEIHKQAYNNLSSKIEEARMAKQAQLGEVRIVSPAYESKYPIKQDRKLNVTISAVVGLLIGILVAFLAEQLDKTRLA